MFNPLEQISVGQTSALFGCAAIVLQQSAQDHFWAPVWSGFVVSFELGVNAPPCEQQVLFLVSDTSVFVI